MSTIERWTQFSQKHVCDQSIILVILRAAWIYMSSNVIMCRQGGSEKTKGSQLESW